MKRPQKSYITSFCRYAGNYLVSRYNTSIVIFDCGAFIRLATGHKNFDEIC